MIEDFKAALGKYGISKPSLFKFEIVKVPNAMLNTRGLSDFHRDIHFFAENVEIPGTQVTTQELRYYDLVSKFAYGKAHDDLNITFRLDKDYLVRRYLEAWINSIYNPSTGDIHYKNDYTGTVHITQLRDDGEAAYTVELQECFPVQMGNISLGWDATGQTNKQSATFTFRRMKVLPNKQVLRAPQSNVRNPETFNQPKTNVQNLVNNNSTSIRQFRVDDQVGLSSLTGSSYSFAG